MTPRRHSPRKASMAAERLALAPPDPPSVSGPAKPARICQCPFRPCLLGSCHFKTRVYSNCRSRGLLGWYGRVLFRPRNAELGRKQKAETGRLSLDELRAAVHSAQVLCHRHVTCSISCPFLWLSQPFERMCWVGPPVGQEMAGMIHVAVQSCSGLAATWQHQQKSRGDHRP